MQSNAGRGFPAVVHNVPVLRRTPGRVVFRAEGTGTAEPAAIFQIGQPRGPAVRTRRRAVQWDGLPCGPAHRAGAVRGVGLAQVVGTGGHGSCPHPTDAVHLPSAFAGQAEGAAGLFFGREDSHRLFDPALAFHAGTALMDTMPATLPGRAVEGANLYEVLSHRRNPPGRRSTCPGRGHGGCDAGSPRGDGQSWQSGSSWSPPSPAPRLP